MRKRADAIDKLVGKNVRVFRLAKGLSQTDLGESTGVTFQQIQKYENGTNRIGSGRLARLAQILEVPISRLFNNDLVSKEEGRTSGEIVTDLLTGPHAIRMLKAFSTITDLNIRLRIVCLTESISERRKT